MLDRLVIRRGADPGVAHRQWLGDLGRRSIAQRTVGSLLVVSGPPFVDDNLGVGLAPEHLLIEAFDPELPVEALGDPVLPGMPRLDVDYRGPSLRSYLVCGAKWHFQQATDHENWRHSVR